MDGQSASRAQPQGAQASTPAQAGAARGGVPRTVPLLFYGVLLVALIAAPMAGAYPVFVLKVLCFALFA